jgi:hypothetical protein
VRCLGSNRGLLGRAEFYSVREARTIGEVCGRRRRDIYCVASSSSSIVNTCSQSWRRAWRSPGWPRASLLRLRQFADRISNRSSSRRTLQRLAAHRLVEQMQDALALQISGLISLCVFQPCEPSIQIRRRLLAAESNYSLGRARLDLMEIEPCDPRIRQFNLRMEATLSALDEIALVDGQFSADRLFSVIDLLRRDAREIVRQESERLGVPELSIRPRL